MKIYQVKDWYSLKDYVLHRIYKNALIPYKDMSSKYIQVRYSTDMYVISRYLENKGRVLYKAGTNKKASRLYIIITLWRIYGGK